MLQGQSTKHGIRSDEPDLRHFPQERDVLLRLGCRVHAVAVEHRVIVRRKAELVTFRSRVGEVGAQREPVFARQPEGEIEDVVREPLFYDIDGDRLIQLDDCPAAAYVPFVTDGKVIFVDGAYQPSLTREAIHLVWVEWP